MKQYEKYKPSGVEWIGRIPSNWKVKRLKFNTYIKARVGWHGLRADEFSLTDGIFCVTGTDLQNGVINWENCYRVSEERYEEDPFIQLKENDLLITKDGTIGKVAIVKDLKEKATLNSGVFVVRPERMEYVTPFMYWTLQSPVFSEYVSYTSKGSTINHLYQETFFNLPFILPLPKEQTAIASYLDEKTAQIDTLIVKKQKLIDLLKEERMAMINHAATKGINPKVKLKPSGVDWLGEIPEHWRVVPMTKYLESIIDYRGRTPTKSESGIFLVTARNIKNGKINYDLAQEFILEEEYEKTMSRGELKEGDVLFTTEAPLGEVANVDRTDIAVAQRIIKFRGKKNIVNNYYLKYWIMSPLFQQDLNSLSTGSTAIGIKASKLFMLKLMIPPFSEQAIILDYITTKESEFDTTISKIEKEIELLQEYRAALISEVVTGKVKVI